LTFIAPIIGGPAPLRPSLVRGFTVPLHSEIARNALAGFDPPRCLV
jgi:hypothetical protein